MSAAPATPPASRARANELLTPYVPRLVVDWLRDVPDQLYREIEGSMVFVDISGFTALSERLARRGKIGAELMRDTLDGVFTALLDDAYDYGAGLLKWGGDALLLLFDGTGHEARACRAAWEMGRTIDRVGRLRAGGSTVTLRMSTGITAGTYGFFLVGSVHRELLVAGPAVTETVATEGVADAGEIALGRELARRLDAASLGEAKGETRLLAAPPAAERLRSPDIGDVSEIDIPSCIPIASRAHVLLERSEPEHRTITAAFIDLMETDVLLERLGVDGLARALDERLRTIQEAALRYEVPFYESDVGQGSVKVLLTAGAPSSTGQDEERILRALRDVLDTPGLVPLRVGVNTGKAFTGDFGPPYRRSYRVFGDAVNTAARVMSRAGPGQLLATDGVLARSRATFRTEPIEPFAAKGKAEPVRASLVGALAGRRDDLRSEVPLVGRDPDLEALLAVVELARRGEGWVIEVAAGAGLGKSRLLHEVVTRSADVTVLRSRCEEYESSTPYFAFRGLVRDALGLDHDATYAVAAARLQEVVELADPGLLPWLPLLGLLLGLQLPETEHTRALDERFFRERLGEVTMQLLFTLLAGSPTMLAVEDVHWMDEASRDLLLRLARANADLRHVILVTNGEPARPWSPFDEEPVRVLAFSLLPLPAARLEAIVAQVTEADPLPAHVMAELARRADGNVFFLFELLHAVREGGSLDALPESVESSIAGDLDRLTPADRTVLRYAAVLGTSFETGLLADAVSGEVPYDDALWGRVAGLVERGEDGTLRFRNTLVRDTAYEGLPYRRRRQLHRRVAAALEGRGGMIGGELAGRLLRHHHEAGNWAKAARFGWLGGRYARSVYANADAAWLLERALAATRRSRATGPELAARIAELLADARYALGEFDAAAASFRLARRRVAGDPVERARLMRREAGAGVHFGRFAEARRLLSKALAGLDGVASAPALAERAEICSWQAMVELRLGRPAAATAWARRAVEGADDADAPTALGRGLMVLDLALVEQGRLDEATHGERALEVFERLGDLNQQAFVWNNLGLVAFYRGRWDEALACYARAKEAWERTGDRASVTFADVNMGEILTGQGRHDEADALLRNALRAARAARNDADVGYVLRELGTIDLRRGNVDAALEQLSAAAAACEAAGDAPAALEAKARIAETHLLAGRIRQAREAAETALVRARAEGGALTTPALLRVLGQVAAAEGDADGAAGHLAEALAAGEAANHAFERTLALACIAELGEAGGATATVRRRRDDLVATLGIVELPPLGRLGET